MKHLTFVLIFITILKVNSFAKDEYKYGKVTMEELSEKKYKNDSLTGAVILYNIGEIETVYSTIYTNRKKIKFYDKNSLNLANQTLVLYDNKYYSEGITVNKIKGKTYNLENGIIVESDLPKSAVKIDRLDDFHQIVHIAFNNVREGSIIEFEVKLDVPGISIPDWYFQENYPVKYSEFSITIPDEIKFRRSTKGYLQIPNPQNNEKKDVTYNSNFTVTNTTWKMRDIPAFVEEPFVYCGDNYITQINHEILSVFRTDITTNWTEILDRLIKNPFHGKLINTSSGFLNKEYDKVKDIKDNVERMKACYREIQKNMSWNYVYSIYSESLKDAFKEKKGSSGDINFILLRLLNECNIESYPVILSTRDNGFVPRFPSFQKFNYMIVLAKINGQSYLLDATDKYLSPNILPTRCLNEKGLVVKEGSIIQWLDLTPKQNATILNSTEINLSEDGTIKGKSTYKRSGYSALETRNEIAKNAVGNKQDWILKQAKNGVEVSNYITTNKDSIDLPIIENFDFNLNNTSTENASTIIFDPIIFETMTENPFKSPERLYPVEFPTPIDKTYIVNISLPDNYIIDEKPKNIVINMPDNSAKFTYQINLIGNAIQLNVKLNIKNTLYSQEQYPNLKEFYALVISKLNEPILLQRK